MRDATINLRALPEQRDLIDQAASLLGKTVRTSCSKQRATEHRPLCWIRSF